MPFYYKENIILRRCLFEGKRELFKDLWIHKNSDWEWKEYPVIALDFNRIPHGFPGQLEKELFFTLEKCAEREGFKLKAPSLGTKFGELI